MKSTTSKQIEKLLEEAYASRVSNLNHSIALATSALQLSRESGFRLSEAKSLNQLSLYYMIMGDYVRSTAMAESAISHYEALDDDKGIADAKYNIAGVYYKTDNFHLGLIYLIDALKIYQKYNDWHNQSRVQKSLGTIYEYIGDQNNAIGAYEKAIEAARKTGDLNLESNAYNNLSGVLLKQNKILQALEMIETSIAMKIQTGDTRGYAFAIYGRGKVRSRAGQHEAAEIDFLEAIGIHHEMGERLGLGMAYNKLGALYLKTGQMDKAKNTATKGYAFSEKYNMAIIKFKCDYLLYRIHKQEGNHLIALEYLERYITERESVINTQTLKVMDSYDMIIRMKTLEKEAELQKERATLIEKKNRAEEGVRVRQEFLSSMSHEIRTPLNAITTIVSLLGNQADEEDKKMLKSLQFASNNLIRIVNDILDFTKLDEGKSKLECHPANLNTICRNTAGTYEALANDKGLILELKTDNAISADYLLDETKLTQILGNLLSNAIKFTDEGRVEMEVSLLETKAQSDRILFKIKDSGEGIPEENIAEIFDSFSQIKPVMTRKQGGTGLGLAIVKKLISLHGSSIHVESVYGKGSVFYFELLLEKTASSVSATTINLQQLTGKNALLAEDTQINAMLMMRLLSKWGIATDHVLNGKLALEQSSERQYDFILMDLHMPEMNGFEATKLIRTSGNRNSKTPIFAVTADIMAKNQEEYVPYFNGFLWKPLEIEKLHSALANVV
ncbi:ATP-binding response regulator [Flavobacterium sp. 3HN19-14]|uniref:ATP-binding response regulator n=1 Tax=Flavobacterium sp. 3HN19-14 TaxID=3448133 RepID=UPI003EE393C2